MAQNFTPDWYELAYNVDTAFGQAENNDLALQSNFAGSNAPGSPVAGQSWFDLDTGTMKLRNIASGWNAQLQGDANCKIWIYTNLTQPGMIIDNSVTDVVLGLRGGNLGSAGGAQVGSWSISGLNTATAGAHLHIWKLYSGGWDYAYKSDGVTLQLLDAANTSKRRGILNDATSADPYCQSYTYYTKKDNGHVHTITVGNTWRPRTAVGTMQKPNLA